MSRVYLGLEAAADYHNPVSLLRACDLNDVSATDYALDVLHGAEEVHVLHAQTQLVVGVATPRLHQTESSDGYSSEMMTVKVIVMMVTMILQQCVRTPSNQDGTKRRWCRGNGDGFGYAISKYRCSTTNKSCALRVLMCLKITFTRPRPVLSLKTAA